MGYEIKIIRKNEHKTSQWSGGTTTQLYIYPEEAEYKELNFIFRISSAKVEVEESLFTSLPDIDREIMILDGEIELKHEGHHNIKLKQFEKDRFKGDWNTKSYGKVTDFNLMMNKECNGELEHIRLVKDEKKDIYLKKNLNDEYYQINKNDLICNKEAYIIYCVSGKVELTLIEKIELNEEDILVFITDKNTDTYNVIIRNISTSDSNLVLNKIHFNEK